MAGRVRLLQNSFTSGELSPRMAGRTDVEFYFNGAETIKNWIVFAQGGVKTRPGTVRVAEITDVPLTSKVRLIPFQFNDEQAYIVEIGAVGSNLRFRFYHTSGQIGMVDTDAVVTNGAFTSDISGWTPRNTGTGTAAWSAGTLLVTTNGAGNEGRAYQGIPISAPFRGLNHIVKFTVTAGSVVFRVSSVVGGNDNRGAVTTHAVGHHAISFPTFGGFASFFLEFEDAATAGASNVDDVSLLDNQPMTLTSEFRGTVDPFEIQFDQSADVMWLTHRTVKPQKLFRSGAIASFSTINYTPTNDPFTSATTFPRAVALWKSRLWFGGTDGGPNEFWASQVDDFENLNPGTSLDNEAINGVIAGGKVNVIRSMIGLDKQLFLGTYGSEMFIRGDTSGKVAPTTVNNNPATEHGSSSLRPAKASGYLLFLQRSKRKIRQLTYDFNTDAFVAPDLLLLSEHLAEDQLVDMAYAEDPDPIIWAVSTNGELLGATFLPTHKILGWHRHTTEGMFESVAVIPHPDGDRDQVWVVARRTINGVVRRFVELFEDTTGFFGQFTVDCALNYEDKRSVNLTLSAVSGTGVTVTAASATFTASIVGDQIWHGKGMTKGVLQVTSFTDSTHVVGDVIVPFASTTIDTAADKGGPWRVAVNGLTGLSHLANHPVTIVADGAIQTGVVVDGAGEIDLNAFAAQVEVGLAYTPELVTLRPEVQGAGTIQGLAVTRSNVKLRVFDTATLEVNGHMLPERSSEDAMDNVVPLFTGDLDVPILGWEEDAKVTIKQTTSQPATVLALVSHVHFGDE